MLLCGLKYVRNNSNSKSLFPYISVVEFPFFLNNFKLKCSQISYSIIVIVVYVSPMVTISVGQWPSHPSIVLFYAPLNQEIHRYFEI